jgi:hypothetical protein
MLVHITILIWVFAPANLGNVVFTSDNIEHLFKANVFRQLQNTNDMYYLGHDDNLVAG